MTNRYLKPAIKFLIGISAGIAMGATSLLADEFIYGNTKPVTAVVTTDIGLNLADKLQLSGGAFFGSPTVSFNPGFRWDLTLGCAVKIVNHLTIQPEFEFGVIYNALDTIAADGVSVPAGGDLFQVPLMANVLINWEFCRNWFVYGGAGAGYDYVIWNTTSIDGVDIDPIHSEETDAAWQGMAGVRYRFDSCALSLGWKYLAFKPKGLKTVGNSDLIVSFGFGY